MTLDAFRSSVAGKLLIALLVLLATLTLAVFLMPWDMLRQPLNRYVSEQLGRRFEITRHLDVRVGRITTVMVDGIEISNPDWARDPFLLKAERAEIDVQLWPLLTGRVVLPRVALTSPQIGLQMQPDGRKTWALSRDASDAGTAPEVGALLINEGSLAFLSHHHGSDVNVKFALGAESASELPLSFQSRGTWRNETFTATGRTGGVLRFSQDQGNRFPIEIDAQAGRTSLKAKGSVTDLVHLAAIDGSFDLQGRNLEDIYKLAGVVLPATPPYRIRGNLGKNGEVWNVEKIQGTLGSSDLSGELRFDRSAPVPRLTGKLHSRVLDFEDLAPVVGLPSNSTVPATSPGPSKRKTVGANSPPPPSRALTAKKRAPAQVSAEKNVRQPPPGKVLPVARLDLPRLNAMNADVVYSAAQVKRMRALPLDSGNLRIRLDAGVLQLDPFSLGVAGGSVAGSIKIDSKTQPASLVTRLDARGVQLNKLFPTIETTKSSLGRLSGQFNLSGRGNSTAEMLATSSGDVSVLMGRGLISNILLEFLGLDGGEVIKFLVRGDKTVELRCAVAAFDVKQGVLQSRAIVLDTVDTVIHGRGQVSLVDESLDLRLEPSPKDMSILSLRTPLNIGGTFASPTAGPDKMALASRAGLALALGVINPLLALAATVETGPGENADCAEIFAQGKSGKSPAVSKAPAPKVK